MFEQSPVRAPPTRDIPNQRFGTRNHLVLKRAKANSPGLAGRLPREAVLALACMAACVVPGDAVAQGHGGRAPGGPGSSSASSAAAQTALLLSDMSAPSQAMPAGVPSWYDWAGHPRINQISRLMRTFRAFTAWGQLYQCAGTPATPRAAAELRALQTWVLVRNSHRWQEIQFTSDLGGAAFAEDYKGPTVAGRFSPSPTATSAQLVRGHNFHFWPSAGRVSLNASDVVAVTVAVQARLAPLRDASTQPCLVLSVGGDMWRSLTAPAGGSSSGDVGIGRFKRVERNWRLFTMTTASAELLRQTPVPPLAPIADDF